MIGLIGSFAAREVFVSTMSIVYNVESGDDENTEPLRDTMRGEKHADGSPIFTPLVCIGLMAFYVLAMQCISTVALDALSCAICDWTSASVAAYPARATMLPCFGPSPRRSPPIRSFP